MHSPAGCVFFEEEAFVLPTPPTADSILLTRRAACRHVLRHVFLWDIQVFVHDFFFCFYKSVRHFCPKLTIPKLRAFIKAVKTAFLKWHSLSRPSDVADEEQSYQIGHASHMQAAMRLGCGRQV